MKRSRGCLFMGLCALTIIIGLLGSAASGESLTTTGSINEDYQFVADDGQIYIVAEPDKMEQSDEIIGKKVKVTASVEESEDMKIITITSYEVIGQKSLTIIGTVNDSYQIVTDDGNIYTVGENEKGDEVISLIAKRVKATGTVDEIEDRKVITISAYEVIGE
jgi:hypothetical protein